MIADVGLVVSSAATARLLAADPTGTGAAIGAGTFLLGFAGYLFKELHRKDDSVWKLMAEKDREIVVLRERAEAAEARAARMERERDFWRGERLSEADRAYDEALGQRRRDQDKEH